MRRIIRFNVDENDEKIAMLNEKLKDVNYKLEHIIEHTINWFEHLKEKYANEHPRLTEIRNFEQIQAAKVVEANQRLMINREEGFIGINLKKDDNNEFVCNCSDIDDIIIFYKDGRYKIVHVADKLYVGKDIEYLDVFVRNDKRTIYNVCYRDGKSGPTFIKRFAVTGIIRDKEYNLAQGKPGTRINYFTANKNGEAEVVRVHVDSKVSKLRVLAFDKDFSEIAIKGRESRGNILTKNIVTYISKKSDGISTLGGTDVFFDFDIQRLNGDNHGLYLGNFEGNDQILAIYKNGDYEITSYDFNNHYSEDIARVEKYEADKVWTAALYDSEQGFAYLKRFTLEPTKSRTSFLSSAEGSRLFIVTDTPFPRLKVNFDQTDKTREPFELDAEEFIGVKSIFAKGKRISNYAVESIEELEPTRFPEPPDEPEETEVPETPANPNVTTTIVDGVIIETNNPTDQELKFE